MIWLQPLFISILTVHMELSVNRTLQNDAFNPKFQHFLSISAYISFSFQEQIIALGYFFSEFLSNFFIAFVIAVS